MKVLANQDVDGAFFEEKESGGNRVRRHGCEFSGEISAALSEHGRECEVERPAASKVPSTQAEVIGGDLF